MMHAINRVQKIMYMDHINLLFYLGNHVRISTKPFLPCNQIDYLKLLIFVSKRYLWKKVMSILPKLLL